MYTIQLSLYQLGLEQLGCEIGATNLLWLTHSGEYFPLDVQDVTNILIDYFSDNK